MNFNIRMGIPEMQELWLDLQEKYRSGNIKKKEEQLYKKWGKALKRCRLIRVIRVFKPMK